MVNFATLGEYLGACFAVSQQINTEDVLRLWLLIDKTRLAGGRIFVAGNGGNATVAEHFALGLSVNAYRETGRTGLQVTNLASSAAYLTAAANDFGGDMIFAAQLKAQAKPGDLFIAISASGKSQNLLNALAACIPLKVERACVVGHKGPIARDSLAVVAAETESSAVFEDVAMMILHWVYGTYMLGEP